MSLNAVSKHIKVLEMANLVRRRKVGRTHLIEPDPAKIALISEWLAELESIWNTRLDRLERLVSNGESDNE